MLNDSFEYFAIIDYEFLPILSLVSVNYIKNHMINNCKTTKRIETHLIRINLSTPLAQINLLLCKKQGNLTPRLEKAGSYVILFFLQCKISILAWGFLNLMRMRQGSALSLL